MQKFNRKNVTGIITKRIEELRHLHAQTLPISQKPVATAIGELEKVRFIIGNMTEDSDRRAQSLLCKACGKCINFPAWTAVKLIGRLAGWYHFDCTPPVSERK